MIDGVDFRIAARYPSTLDAQAFQQRKRAEGWDGYAFGYGKAASPDEMYLSVCSFRRAPVTVFGHNAPPRARTASSALLYH